MQSKWKISGRLPVLPLASPAELSGQLPVWLLINSVHEETKEIRHLHRLQALQQSSSHRPLALKTAESKSPYKFYCTSYERGTSCLGVLSDKPNLTNSCHVPGLIQCHTSLCQNSRTIPSPATNDTPRPPRAALLYNTRTALPTCALECRQMHPPTASTWTGESLCCWGTPGTAIPDLHRPSDSTRALTTLHYPRLAFFPTLSKTEGSDLAGSA